MNIMAKIKKSVDIRTHPDPKEAIKFNQECSRRYINIGIALRNFFQNTALALKDEELKEYYGFIESAIYTENKEVFDMNVRLFQGRLQELGVWKHVKSMSSFQKAKIIAKLGKFAKKHKDKIKDYGEQLESEKNENK